jgi:hypothetical protein
MQYDWIGVFAVGSNSEMSWSYVNGCNSGSVTLAAPGVAGTYEVRYLTNNSYNAADTETLNVSSAPPPPPPPPPFEGFTVDSNVNGTLMYSYKEMDCPNGVTHHTDMPASNGRKTNTVVCNR